MAVRIQLRRGNNSEFSGTLVLSAGEAALVEDEKVLIVGDGSSTYSQLKAAGKFINYQTEQGLGTVGGANGTGETPLSVRGASGQSVPIFQVTDNGGTNKIFSVTDNDTTICTIENHGDTADDVLVVQGKSGQDQDASGGDLLQVRPDSGDTGKGLTVDHAGNVSIVPTDDSDAVDTALRVTASNDSDIPIMRVQDAIGTDLFKIALAQNSLIKQLLLGNSPNHADPSNFAVLRSGTTPDNTDSSAASDHLDTPHFRLKTTGSGTTIRGMMELNANDTAGASQKAIAITKSGTSGNLAEIDYSGKATLADAEISATSRSLADASVLRTDEILRFIEPFKYVTDTYTDSNYNSTTEHLLPLDVASSSHDFASKTSFPNQPNLTLVPIIGTNASPDTNGQFGTGTGDTTNAYLLKIPPNSGILSLKITLTSGQSFFGGSGLINVVGGDAKFYSYTAQTATSSDNKTQLGGVVAALTVGSPTATVVGTVNVANSSVEKFVAVSFDGNHDTDGDDLFRYTFEVSRDGNAVAL